MADEATVMLNKNGPYHIQGRIRLTLPDGQVVETEDETWLCRCGGSKTKPFCDGTHKRIGFQADEAGTRTVTDS